MKQLARFIHSLGLLVLLENGWKVVLPALSHTLPDPVDAAALVAVGEIGAGAPQIVRKSAARRSDRGLARVFRTIT